MTDRSNECFIKNKTFKHSEGETDLPKFKLLYQNLQNSDRDKSSGASSDEETQSSSLVPIPDTLRQIRGKIKRTVSGAEQFGSAYDVSQVLEEPSEKITNSLEELRKKYTLKNDTSVALKMNSANQILDDILNSSTLNLTANNNVQTKYFKQQEVNSKAQSYININEVNETSSTESTLSITKHYPHIMDYSHPIAYDLLPPSCISQESSQSLHNRIEKEGAKDKKKTLLEKIQDFRIKCKIQSVYRSLQRTKNPFARDKKEPEVIKNQQGIPGIGYQENEPLGHKCAKCCHLKKMNLDLVESSELSQSGSRSTERKARHCTCLSHRECDCPEVIPTCKCMGISSEVLSKAPKHNLSHFEVPSNNNIACFQEMLSDRSESPLKEPSNPLERDTENNEDKKKKKNTLLKHFQECKKHCSQERRIVERTDIYYFDHGNSAYYQTTDNHPIRYTECLVERTDHYATKFWAEFFGTIEIGVAFLISFFLQLYRFFFTSIIRSLTVGLLQIFSDYFFKPLLTITFNGIIQPCLILAYNIATSVRDLFLPISQIFGFFAKEIAFIIKSCRLVEVVREKQATCCCGNKV